METENARSAIARASSAMLMLLVAVMKRAAVKSGPALVILAVGLSGCANLRTYGTPFNYEETSAIYVGMSPEEVRFALGGDPSITDIGGKDPRKQWYFNYMEYRSLTFREALQLPAVTVLFFLPWPKKSLGRGYECRIDFVDGAVEDFEFSSNETTARKVGF